LHYCNEGKVLGYVSDTQIQVYECLHLFYCHGGTANKCEKLVSK
jgi:hypothetical protein